MPSKLQESASLSLLHSTSWTLVHVVLFSLAALAVKSLNQYVPVSGQIFFRSAVAVAIVVATSRGAVLSSLVGEEKKLLFLRGVLGFIGLFGAFYSFTILPIAIAMTIIGTTPLFVMVFGAVALGEKIKPDMIVYGLGVAVSIFFVVQPESVSVADYEDVSLIGVAMAFMSSIAAALAFTTVRAVVQKVGVQAVVFWFAGVCLVGSLIFDGFPSYVTDIPTHALFLLVALCVLGVTSDLAKTQAYKFGVAWYVSLLSVLSVAVSGLLAWMFIGQTISVAQWIGILFMMLFMAAAIHRSRGR
ncbi:DMT family transporter [uncultured Roseibium sp.]|uniref:DMT family transporter n=1 Tax=uncultured Roseibium sp. TaxID=1936171 RepID=UPI002616B4E5|nr:DMT family transporter [uncultured Roseibium sp.]